jgi:hypothetical protein
VEPLTIYLIIVLLATGYPLFWVIGARLFALPWIVRLIVWYAERDPYDHIYGRDGTVYMLRFWVLRERDWFPWAIRLHVIMRPDEDRHYHDHPYDYRRIGLSGGYLEDVKDGGFVWRGAGTTSSHPATHFHRIVTLDKDAPTRSLFIYRYRAHSNPWGFLVNGNKVPWREYLGN